VNVQCVDPEEYTRKLPGKEIRKRESRIRENGLRPPVQRIPPKPWWEKAHKSNKIRETYNPGGEEEEEPQRTGSDNDTAQEEEEKRSRLRSRSRSSVKRRKRTAPTTKPGGL